MKLAVLSDIHSNLLALEAVWKDLQQHSPDRVVCLGDHVWGLLQPREVIDFLVQHGVVCISGNQDREVHAPGLQTHQSKDFAFLHSDLTPSHLQWLKDLPDTLTLEQVLLCHGTPASDTTHLLETVTEHGARLSSAAEILQRLEGVQAEVVLCGHSHLSRVVQTGRQLVVNPGSVGMPAYDDDLPHPHAMESGSPHARYATLQKTHAGWQVTQHQVAYPWDTAADLCLQRGRSDRATWIRTGRV